MSNFVDPDRAQFETFKELDRDHPIEMLNLVRFREQAVYPADHPLADANLTGQRLINATAPRPRRSSNVWAHQSYGAGPCRLC